MTQSPALPQDDAMQTIRQMVVTHLVGLDEDPRETTADQLIDELSEALHWDAQDADTRADAELADADALIRQALAEYCRAKTALMEHIAGEEALVATYLTLENEAEACFSAR